MNPSDPAEILLIIEHRDDLSPMVLAKEYATALHAAGCGDVVTYTVAGMGDFQRGTTKELLVAIKKASRTDDGFFALTTKDGTGFQFVKGQGGRDVWIVEAKLPSEKRPKGTWMKSMVNVARSAIGMPGFVDAILHRSGWAGDFVPYPPLARANHAVTTTDQEVAERYEDSAVFWRVWDTVEKHGKVRFCVRGLDALDELSWLGRTFEDTMQLARTARPGLTEYYDIRKPEADYAPWWEYGDIRNEKAGYPALSYSGYDAKTRTVEFAGFCSRTPLERGGEDPRDVLIREIHEVRALVEAGKDAQGRRVDTVRVVFAEEWMAREQRRPLLDVGAKVFFMSKKTGDLVAVEE